MRLPDFLLIGAMKAATTTMYRDLSHNPGIYLSRDKEPGNLLDNDITTPLGRQRYAALYLGADERQVCGDVTTEYAKRPETDGLAKTAREVLGGDTCIIYIVRHPITRAVSHYWHMVASGEHELPPLNEAIVEYPEFVSYSRYAYQIEPWIEEFGRRQVLIVRFEDYVESRRDTIKEVSRFLGVEPFVEPIDPSRAYNETKGKPKLTRLWGAVSRSRVYCEVLRPLLSDGVRSTLRRSLLPAAETYTEPLEASVAEQLAAYLQNDVERLGELMGVDDEVWNLSEW